MIRSNSNPLLRAWNLWEVGFIIFSYCWLVEGERGLLNWLDGEKWIWAVGVAEATCFGDFYFQLTRRQRKSRTKERAAVASPHQGKTCFWITETPERVLRENLLGPLLANEPAKTQDPVLNGNVNSPKRKVQSSLDAADDLGFLSKSQAWPSLFSWCQSGKVGNSY